MIVRRWTTLEDNEVGSRAALRRVLDEERNALDLHIAELVELHAAAFRFRAGKDSFTAVSGESIREMEDAELLHRITADEGEDVAQRLGTEGVETFRHEAATGVFALVDVALRDLTHADLRGECDGGGVFTGDDALKHFALLRGNVEGPEAWIDLAIRIDDVHEQLGGAMRAHAIERRADGDADVAELVADGAGGGEEHFALCGVSRLLDLWHEFGDDGILCGVVDLEEVVGAFGDLLVRMRAQACDITGGKHGTINFASLHGIKKSACGLGAFEDGVESLRKWFRL